MQDNIITLWGQDGPMEFEFLDLIVWKKSEFAVLLPVGSTEGIVEIIRLDDGDEFTVIRDEEAEAVFRIFRQKNQDIFDFEEDTL